MTRLKLLARLLERFAEVGHPWPWPGDVKLISMRPGRHQRSAGAFSWTLVRASDGFVNGMWGGTARATHCATAPEVCAYVDPAGDCDLIPEGNRGS